MRQIMEVHPFFKAFKYYLHFTHRTENKNFKTFVPKGKDRSEERDSFLYQILVFASDSYADIK